MRSALRSVMTSRSVMISLLAGAAVAAAAFVPSVSQSRGDLAPGDLEMNNLEPVFTYDFSASERSENGHTPTQGTDLAFWTTDVAIDGQVRTRDFVIVGDHGDGAFVFDITDPEHPVEASFLPCETGRVDVDVTSVDTEAGPVWLAAIATDGSGDPCRADGLKNLGERGLGGVGIYDVTDPFNPVGLYGFGVPGSAHNFTFHPTKPYGYAANGDLPGGVSGIPIIDFTNPFEPTLALHYGDADDEFVIGGPHDITFSPDGERAYVGSENNYVILDVTDPAAPSLVSVTPNAGTYAHGYFVSPDRRYVLGNNESLALGGFFAGGSTVCPGEGLMIYDIEGSNEASPIPMGYFVPPVSGPAGPGESRACTSHFGNIAPNGHVMTVGWYIAGTRIFDFSDPSNPTEVASAVLDGTEVWAAKTYKGPYVYVGDMVRGFDVLKWTGEGEAPWLTE